MLTEIREGQRLKLEEIAAALEVAISTVSRWEVGDTNIPTKRLDEIAAAYGCRVTDIFAEDDDAVPRLLKPSALPSPANDDETIDLRRVDMGYGMGPGTNIDDYPDEGTMRFGLSFLQSLTKASTEMLYVARGDGDSMAPTMINDDMVVIDTSQKILNLQDRIWAVSVHGAGMIKRLRSAGKGRVRILSDNPAVPPDEVDAEDLHIVGRVIWVGRRI